MDIRPALKSQYHGALAMVRQAIERCPEEIWLAGAHPRTTWRVAYHALFFADLYMQPDVESYRVWAGHRSDAECLEETPWPPHVCPKVVEPFSREELLDYCRQIDGRVDATLDRLDLGSSESGFPWYPIPKLDHLIMSIRHVQQHAGQLSERIYGGEVELDWIGSAPTSQP